MPQGTTKKYPGLGYYCNDCMYKGCFSDECDAQNPSGEKVTYERTNAVHRRLGSSVLGNPPRLITSEEWDRRIKKVLEGFI